MNKLYTDTTWINYLRSFITILVVVHHSALAYTTFAYFDTTTYINSTHPIVDHNSWIGFDLLVSFNDSYFMALMFLIGGLFLTKSIKRKGEKRFMIDRLQRLLIPFLTIGTVFMLLSYFPAYYLNEEKIDVFHYIQDFFTTQKWPVGPPWFLWELFLFNMVFALCYKVVERMPISLKVLLSKRFNKPFVLISILVVSIWLLYVPLTYNIGAYTWTGIGPFDFQLNRVLLYFGYFIFGMFIGKTDFNNGIFSDTSKLIKSWKVWSIISIILFFGLTYFVQLKTTLVNHFNMSQIFSDICHHTLFVLTGLMLSISFIVIFKRFVNDSYKWWNSISENAYMIYLCHYIFVIWFQFLLLNIELSAIAKFFVTFILSFLISWGLSIILRKIEFVRKYL